MNGVVIEVISPQEFERHINALADILYQCVHDGASVSFVLPFSLEQSKNFWSQRVFPKINTNECYLLVAKYNNIIAGTVQLDCAMPDNQLHRAEVSKLLVSPNFQRKGIAKKLMLALESKAQDLKKSLLTLDTRTGDKAESLYIHLDYKVAGTIPFFAKDTRLNRKDSTTVMYKIIDE